MEPATEIRYQRLTRTRTGVTFSSLWLGPDHLLRVNSSGYMETYRRFYFRDIQAIVIHKGRRRAIWNAILAVPIVGCLIGMLACLRAFSDNEVAVIVCAIALGIFLLMLLVNNFLGAGCVTYLRTAVQVERLPSLCRIPKTRRVLDKIRPLIAAAQGGELSAEIVSAQIRESVESVAKTPPAQTVAENPNNPPPPNV